jgi:hypothetical protein
LSGIQHPAVRNRRTIVTKTVLCIQIDIHGVMLHSSWQHNPVNNIIALKKRDIINLMILRNIIMLLSVHACIFTFQDKIFLIFLDFETNRHMNSEHVLF